MDIKPISTKAGYNAALKQVEKLWDAQPGTPDGDAVEILVTLIQAYEAKHFPIDDPDPVEAIKFMMEQKGLDRAALEPAIGPRGRVSEVLNRKRALTLPMIRALSPLLDIPLGILAREYKVMQVA
ncbi:MAG: type II toxin-antitoxin system HigA family antitoxin [Alphaproteobacteria bacterium]